VPITGRGLTVSAFTIYDSLSTRTIPSWQVGNNNNSRHEIHSHLVSLFREAHKQHTFVHSRDVIWNKMGYTTSGKNW